MQPTLSLQVTDLLAIWETDENFQELTKKLLEGKPSLLSAKGLTGSLKHLLLAALHHKTGRQMLLVADDRDEALNAIGDLETLLPEAHLALFPASSKHAYQLERIDNANVLQRAELLEALSQAETGNLIIVTYAEALSEKVLNRKSLASHTFHLRTGDKLSMEFVEEILETYGFEQVDFVQEPGQYARRGGILDIFSFSLTLPVRVEFDDELVERIRTFEVESQLTQATMEHLTILPNVQTRMLEEERVSFFQYVSPATIVVSTDLARALQEVNKTFERATAVWAQIQADSHAQSLQRPPEALFADAEAVKEDLKAFALVEVGKRTHFRKHDVSIEWDTAPQPSFRKQFKLLADHLLENVGNGIQNYLCCESEKQVERMREILLEICGAVPFEGLVANLHEGFLDRNHNIAVYTDHQIFERYHRYREKKAFSKSQALTLKELQELKPGDYVVHVNHGIGRFAGLEKTHNGENIQESIKIIYEDGDTLFVNVSSLFKLSKYTGKDGAPPKMHKLGSAQWTKTRTRIQKRLREMSYDLVAFYAKRKIQEGHAFAPDNYLQYELEASFEFEETPDQLRTVEDVKKDMENKRPMDRLVCGDVGFGKTEVAVRAAFKAVVDGKQVGVLVPTTILALQHYRTFAKRMADLPVTVEFLNRFRSAKEQTDILKRLAEGKIDILIGTHRLLSADVKFTNLGLLVIDEEHKFGVAAKEKLRQLRLNVDTLTMTATPIPRTLQFSLLGIRDLSLISTPPPNRQPVETLVLPFSAELIRDAVARELKRGGQVFFVHNRIHDLDSFAVLIKELVPDARVAVAHGQLEGEVMEEIMVRFINGESDVLVCTTIIESGLDIPNANTIIINQAQNFGLSDLHQMRGRVGRSNRKAHCILMAPDLASLTSDARRRLEAIEEFSDLGSGLQIAMRDLDIRGAGDLFGKEQTGFIDEIGFDLYQKMLEEAIQEIKKTYFAEAFADSEGEHGPSITSDCTVELEADALLPDAYIRSTAERFAFYKRISETTTEEGLQQISRELLDRFGIIPEATLTLLDTIRIREIGAKIGFSRVVWRQKSLRCFVPSDAGEAYFSSERFQRLLAYVQQHGHDFRLKQQGDNLSIITPAPTVLDARVRLKDLYSAVQSGAETVSVQVQANEVPY
jgi:transcription-repair coupling factor (superfamily II helicase)